MPVSTTSDSINSLRICFPLRYSIISFYFFDRFLDFSVPGVIAFHIFLAAFFLFNRRFNLSFPVIVLTSSTQFFPNNCLDFFSSFLKFPLKSSPVLIVKIFVPLFNLMKLMSFTITSSFTLMNRF